MKLVIGNKNYSSWSLRPWLLLTHFNLPFEEINVSLGAENVSDQLRQFSPSRRVPVLIDGPVTVWDSLAICETVSERYLAGNGWPTEEGMRAHARSISAEMHSSFLALRHELPMNCRARRKIAISPLAQKDIARIDAIWSDCISKSNANASANGPWLFGDFSIADCMFAPVVLRFRTYGIGVSDASQRYMDNVLANKHLQAWIDAGKNEKEVLAEDETGEDVH